MRRASRGRLLAASSVEEREVSIAVVCGWVGGGVCIVGCGSDEGGEGALPFASAMVKSVVTSILIPIRNGIYNESW